MLPPGTTPYEVENDESKKIALSTVKTAITMLVDIVQAYGPYMSRTDNRSQIPQPCRCTFEAILAVKQLTQDGLYDKDGGEKIESFEKTLLQLRRRWASAGIIQKVSLRRWAEGLHIYRRLFASLRPTLTRLLLDPMSELWAWNSCSGRYSGQYTYGVKRATRLAYYSKLMSQRICSGTLHLLPQTIS